MMAVYVFSKEHHIPLSTLHQAHLRGKLPFTREEHRVNGRVVKEWLNAEEHAVAWQLWHHRPDFTPCSLCPEEG